MATKTTTSTTPEQTVNDGILRVVAAHNIDLQKARYKAMRAIAWQAFIESIEAGDFDKLVERASANVGSLPSGWEIKPKAAPKPTSQTKVQRAAATRKPAARKGSTVATSKGTVIAEQRHVDADKPAPRQRAAR